MAFEPECRNRLKVPAAFRQEAVIGGRNLHANSGSTSTRRKGRAAVRPAGRASAGSLATNYGQIGHETPQEEVGSIATCIKGHHLRVVVVDQAKPLPTDLDFPEPDVRAVIL